MFASVLFRIVILVGVVIVVVPIISQLYNTLHDTAWSACDKEQNPFAPICVTPPNGGEVLEALSGIYPVVENKDQVVQDIGIMLAIAVFWKLTYIAGVLYKSSLVSKIHEVE